MCCHRPQVPPPETKRATPLHLRTRSRPSPLGTSFDRRTTSHQTPQRRPWKACELLARRAIKPYGLTGRIWRSGRLDEPVPAEERYQRVATILLCPGASWRLSRQFGCDSGPRRLARRPIEVLRSHHNEDTRRVRLRCSLHANEGDHRASRVNDDPVDVENSALVSLLAVRQPLTIAVQAPGRRAVGETEDILPVGGLETAHGKPGCLRHVPLAGA